MEERVARLEAVTEHMASDIADMKGDIRDLRDRMRAVEVKIEHLPGKGFIVSALLVSLLAIAGLIGFGEQIQSLMAP
mgnify:CR=1 FL=1